MTLTNTIAEEPKPITLSLTAHALLKDLSLAAMRTGYMQRASSKNPMDIARKHEFEDSLAEYVMRLAEASAYVSHLEEQAGIEQPKHIDTSDEAQAQGIASVSP